MIRNFFDCLYITLIILLDMIKYCQGFWKRFWFSWLFSCTMIYLLYWLNFLMELMIFNIFQTHFKMLCQRRSGDLNISLLLYDSWKLKAFSFNSIPSENVFFKFHIMRAIVRRKMYFYLFEKKCSCQYVIF